MHGLFSSIFLIKYARKFTNQASHQIKNMRMKKKKTHKIEIEKIITEKKKL